MSVRLTIVQYGGDYRETYNRFAKGGKETYYAQRYSVNFVGSLAQRLDQVAVICGVSEERYDTLLENGVRAIGGGLKPGFDPSELVPVLSGTRPTKLVLHSPLVPVLRWALASRVRTIAITGRLLPEARLAYIPIAAKTGLLFKSASRRMGWQSWH